MTLLSKRRVAAATAIAALSLFACSLIVPADPPDVRCASADPSACPSGTTCDLASGRCVRGGSLPDVNVDPDVEEIDGGDAGDEDVVPGLAGLGADCVVDSDCESNLCGTPNVLSTSIISGSTKPICTSTCCTSAECPSGFVCFSGGTGGNYCVPAAKAQRTPPASGGKAAGATCSGDDTECRSGLCEGGRCVDTCCVANDCAAGSTCRVYEIMTPAPSHFVWACATGNSGGKDAGPDASCSVQADCRNDNCIGNVPNRVCTPSCCNAADCTQQGFTGRICRYGTTGTDQLKFCTLPVNGGTAIGTDCQFDINCTSGYCDPELKKCAQLCCTDDDCASRQSCKPSKIGDALLRCVPL